MRSLRRAALYGVVVWLVPFIVAFAIFPIRETNRPLFESIMPVAIASVVVALALAYVRQGGGMSRREGTLVGLLWLGVSVAIDAPLMLLGGPMRMTIAQYVADIAVTYLMIPVITIGIAAATHVPGAAAQPARL